MRSGACGSRTRAQITGPRCCCFKGSSATDNCSRTRLRTGSSRWPSGQFFYLVIFLLMTIGIAVPLLVARAFAPEHVVIFIEWWEIALFAVFWGLETRRVARLRANTVKKRHPDRGPLKEPHRIMVGEQSTKGRVSEKTEALDAEQEPRRAQQEPPLTTLAQVGSADPSARSSGTKRLRFKSRHRLSRYPVPPPPVALDHSGPPH